MKENFLKKLFKLSNQNPLHPAIIQNGCTLTYEMMVERVVQYNLFFKKIKIKKGERVILQLPNTIEFILSYYSLMVYGAITVPVNATISTEELKKICEDCNPKAIITLRENYKNAPLNNCIEKYIYADRPDGEVELSEKEYSIQKFRQNSTFNYSEIQQVETELENENKILSINYTYDGSGIPKGCVHTLKSYDACIETLCEYAKASEQTRSIAFLPFNHVFALMGGIFPVIYAGGAVVIQSKFNLTELIDLVHRYKIDLLNAVPFIVRYFYKNRHLIHDKMNSIKYFLTGGEHLNKVETEKYQKVFPFKILQGYGLTECFMLSCNNLHDNREGTLGKFLGKQIDYKLLPTQNDSLKQELWVKTDSAFSGYWDKKIKADDIAPANDHWVKTGDLIDVDEDGYLHYKGRNKNITKVGGLLVDLTEVQNKIEDFGVKSVVIEIQPDRLIDNKIIAHVNPGKEAKIDPSGIKRELKKSLSSYKVPMKIYISENLNTQE